MQTVFVNPERCIGCLQCELACAVEHSTAQDESVAFLERPVPRKRVHVGAGPTPTLAFPNRCRHCDPAPCLQVCPSGAITRDDEFDLVLVDPKRCIGCAMCAVVCPFDVVTFHPLAEGPDSSIAVAVKCDGCVDRLREGRMPACAEVCKVDALVFGELNELVAAGSLREAGAVLAASGATATPPPGGDPLAAWRAWGRATQEAAGAAAEWDPGRLAGDGAGVGTKNADGQQGGTA
ncbi:MAG: 4Fe-4S dicluster domain-containing protein [Acidimicrobiales bacterium]|jgi:carbon-monoxide dehydrogenase iron sulfur subunit